MIKELKEADEIIDEINGITDEAVEMLRTKLEKTTSSISDISVQGSHKMHSREDALLLLAEMTSMLDEAKEGLKGIYKRIPKEDRNLKIYFDKVYFKMNNAQLELKYGISKRQVNRIIKEIEKNK